jgi:ferredoxin
MWPLPQQLVCEETHKRSAKAESAKRIFAGVGQKVCQGQGQCLLMKPGVASYIDKAKAAIDGARQGEGLEKCTDSHYFQYNLYHYQQARLWISLM